MSFWVVLGVAPGREPRELARVETVGNEGISVNREDVPQPSLRASEMANDVAKLTEYERKRLPSIRMHAAIKNQIGLKKHKENMSRAPFIEHERKKPPLIAKCKANNRP